MNKIGPRHGTSDAVMTGVQVLLGAVIVAGILDFGGVRAATFLAMGASVVALASFAFWKWGWPVTPLPATIVAGALVLVPTLQMIPLPLGMLRVISPARAALHESLVVPILGGGGPVPLTINSNATMLALLKMVACILVFLLVFNMNRLARRSILLPVLLVIGLFEAGYGLYQYLAHSPYIFSHAAPAQEAATGTYVNRNNYAGLLAMVLPFLVAQIIGRFPRLGDHREGRQRHRGGQGQGVWLLWLVVFLVVTLAMLFSQSRGGIVSGIAGIAAAALISLARFSRRAGAIILVAVFGLPLAYAGWIGLDPVLRRFEALDKAEVRTLEGRLPIWKDSIALVRDYPLTGTGLGTYNWSVMHYQTQMLGYRYEHAHNDYLEFAAELGVPCALLLFGSLWFLVLRVARSAVLQSRTGTAALAAGCAGALIAVLLHCLVDFDLQMPATAFLFAWVLGAAVHLVSQREAEHDSPRLFVATPAVPVSGSR